MRRQALGIGAALAALLGWTASCSSSDDPASTPNQDAGADATTGTDAAEAGVDAAPDVTTSPDDLTPQLDALVTAHGVPALAAMVWRDGAVIAQGVSGVRKYDDPTVATLDDRWHLGSDTKAMTATLLAPMLEAGTLSLTDPISKLFAGETLDAGYQPVTLQQLLEHRAGMPANLPADIWQDWWTAAANASDPAQTRSDGILELLAQPPPGTVGSFEYSNAGYVTIGVALQRATGKSWEALMQSELFTPLAMSSCGFGPPGTASDPPSEPWGHRVIVGTLTPMSPDDIMADNPPAAGPAGTAHCTLADWGKFLHLHLAAAKGGASEPFSPTQLQALDTPSSGGEYAGGWGVGQIPNIPGTVLTHDGSNTMWYARALIAPTPGVVLAIVTNRGDAPAQQAVNQLTQELAASYLK